MCIYSRVNTNSSKEKSGKVSKEKLKIGRKKKLTFVGKNRIMADKLFVLHRISSFEAAFKLLREMCGSVNKRTFHTIEHFQ